MIYVPIDVCIADVHGIVSGLPFSSQARTFFSDQTVPAAARIYVPWAFVSVLS